MGRLCFLRILLVSSLLVLCFSHGFGRKVMETVEHEDSSVQVLETVGESRNLVETMDYEQPGPNTNPKAGFVSGPPRA